MPTLIKAAFVALLWSVPALLWSTTAYHWDEPGHCQWQEQQAQQQTLENWQWEWMAGDTIRPPFPMQDCDLVCPDFQVNHIVVNAHCGQNDGSAKVEPLGYPEGTVFSYSWTGGVSTTNEADSLAAGIYVVTITVQVSGNGSFRTCHTETIVPVSDVDGPEVQLTSFPADCFYEDGRIILNISSGTPPFHIDWTRGSREANGPGPVEFNNLAAGTYTFVVTDANGCTTSVIGQVDRDNSDIFDVTLSATPTSGCGASDGTLTVNIQGSFPPYQITVDGDYTFTTNDNPYTFTGLPAGLYQIRVGAEISCSEVREIQVTDGSPPCNIGWTTVDADCSDGIGYLIFDGSGAAYETYQVRQQGSVYVLHAIDGDRSGTIELPAGKYRIKRISSQDQCICEFGAEIKTPEELTAQVDVTDDCTPGGVSTGSIEVVEVTGGTPPYSINITDSSDNPVADPSNLGVGTYTVKITDANNCQPLLKEVEIEGCPCGPIEVAVSTMDTLICEGESVTLEALITSTDPPAAITWFDENDVQVGTGASLPLTPAAGIHQYTVVAESSCSADTDTATARVKVAENAPLVADPDSLLVCNDSPVTIDVSGPLAECVVWLNSNGEPVDTGLQFTVIPQPGINQYIATLPGAENCVTPDTVIVEYRTETVSVSTSGMSKICEGEEVCLLATFTPDNSTVNITWTDISGAVLGNDPELCVTPAAGIQQYLVIADNGCSADTATATVTVIAENTKIDITPADTVTVCTQEEVCFEVADATLADCIEWV
ncbi:MAG: hypothetical protein KDD06_01055, partial [Phaeodactylibacter sp.]|nr:hypothetical protein [Phaeodactylibacter sp.]